MYWSFRIFGELFIQCVDILGDVEIIEEQLEETLDLIKLMHPIPIITPQELNWTGPGTLGSRP